MYTKRTPEKEKDRMSQNRQAVEAASGRQNTNALTNKKIKDRGL